MKRFLPFLLFLIFHSIAAQSFMYLNAVDFDFTANKAGYTGHFNIYSPPADSSMWGFNAGVMKINYSTSDSTMLYREDYVRLKPLDQLAVGSKYEAKYNEYKTKTRNSSYSIYMQALYALRNPDGNSSKIFAHAHGELLIANFEISQMINTLQSDTVTVKSLDSIPERMLNFQVNKNDRKSKSITGYFGFGATFDLKCTEKARLFFQPTVGLTTNYPQPSSVNTDGNAKSYYQSQIKEWNAFYLVRSYFRYILSTKSADGGSEAISSELILGTDIRGLFPKYAPFYSVYIGLNLDLSKLADLFKTEDT